MTWIVSVIVAGLMAVSTGSAPPNTSQLQSPPIAIEKVSTENNQPQNISTSQQQDRIDQTYPLSANGRVSLNNVNGTVIIEAWDKPEARVEATKTVDCDKPYQINVNINSTQNSLQIETDFQRENYGKGWNNNNRCREARVDYKLTLPRSARLDEIETVNGNVTLGGMTDLVKVSTVNGKITANNLRGTINLSSVNGTLDADFESLENVREVRISMVNGRIDLQLPSDIEATLKADTVNGSITNDFGLPVRKGEYVGRNLYGRLGNGGITVKLDGVNGTINVRRKQDGRTPKAVINLLPQKGKNSSDDDEMDDENSLARPPKPLRPLPVPAPRIPRPPRTPNEDSINNSTARGINENIVGVVDETIQAVNETTREQIRKSLEDAQKEIAKTKIDKEALRRQIREGMEDARQQMREAANFHFNFGESSFAPLNERETKTVAVEGKPRVTINASGGSVSIRGWDRSEVSYAIARRAVSTANSAEQATVTFDKKGSEVNLSVPKSAANYRLEIYVPRNCNLRVTSQEQIRVENVKGELKLDGGNQSIDVRDAGGDLNVRADGGRVRVIGFDGATIVKTLNGDIALEGDFSNLDTETADGNTLLTLNPTTTAEIKSSDKNVSFEGVTVIGSPATTAETNVWRIGSRDGNAKKYFLKTSDGKIVVRSANIIRVTRNYNWFTTAGII